MDGKQHLSRCCITAAMVALIGTGARAAERNLKIAVIPMGTTHVYWKSVHAGAVKAARETGVEIIWQGPQREDDRKMQIEVVQNFISRGVDGIVLAPLDEIALVNPVRIALKRKIQVVIIDTGLKYDKYASFIATDNVMGGKLAGKRLAEVMQGKGKAIMLRYAEGSASTMEREEGFLEGIKKHGPNIELVSTNQYAGVTVESAFQAAQNLLNRLGDIDGAFCPNESSTFGMLRALKTSGKAGKVKFVGFDSSEPLVAGLRAGEIHGLLVQDPVKMGYLGVKYAVDAIEGKSVPHLVDTGVVVVTPENMDQPAMKELIEPDLGRWLD